ncbi:DNase I-like protein [Glarea lozoyensis ATCC 20868]|uniref:DNase I-like protein n=1 Tax=Glarea lozoyensis (strain ATCC 20868 / MF5171) TaxID=1116229 RepID=S3CV60_GLAL2|nr:DNase I-like protein [Glarea lozoyensis ATCC 20868]EPE30272.1 DNase I-like protein [Glarea lozoyensis ATCC 20868]
MIVTWNIDATSTLPESRISAIISHILGLGPKVDVILLQEVSRAALAFLLSDSRIQDGWFSSEAGDTSWEGQSFASLTLMSRSRFAYTKDKSISSMGRLVLGPVWRVKYPSRFGRDALCCDIFINSSRIRLVNVHLDSLPIQPSQRPRQIAIVASLLRSAGCGLVAGDFNPVLPGDERLTQENHLVDVWDELRPEESGFTWGVDGTEPFPPNRMDKIATLGLKAQSIDVMHPGFVSKTKGIGETKGEESVATRKRDQESEDVVPWSDHSGLKSSFRILGN